MRRQLFFYPTFFIVLFFVSTGQALLIEDLKSNHDIPKNFRMFTHLKASGSAQFTGVGADYIKKKIPAGHSIIMVDLRKEPHGFLRNEPISWYGRHNSVNARLTPKQVEEDQKKRLADLRSKKAAPVCILCKDTGIQKKQENSACSCKNRSIQSVQAVKSEEQLVQDAGMRYKRFYVQEAHAPNASQVDAFVHFVKNLPKNAWLHMHCRAGKGRTTTFLVMYDILRNCSKASLDQIIQRQTRAGGTNLLSEDTSNSRWKVAPFAARTRFIKKFYAYCKEALPSGITWSAYSTPKNS